MKPYFCYCPGLEEKEDGLEIYADSPEEAAAVYVEVLYNACKVHADNEDRYTIIVDNGTQWTVDVTAHETLTFSGRLQ